MCVVVAEFNCPSTTLELVYKRTIKCSAIVETLGREPRNFGLLLKANLSVHPVFGKLIWVQINQSHNFRVHLTAWLFEQWRLMAESGNRKVIL